MDRPNLNKLAKQFMIKTIKTKPGDNIWIEYIGPEAKKVAAVCAATVKAAGANPYLVDSSSALLNEIIPPLSTEDLKQYGLRKLEEMKSMQGYIRIKDDADEAKLTLSPDIKRLYTLAMRPMIDYRVNNTRWLVVTAPTKELAALNSMDMEKFEKYYLNVCLLDYGVMTEPVKPLQKLMANTRQVHIFSPNQETDLTFKLIGQKAEPCIGTVNLPDGECFSAPIKNSVNGKIKFCASTYQGERFSFIKLKFKNGRIVRAVAENKKRTKTLNSILDTDEDARYTGEFAINFNPFIQNPVGKILFDEKINGGIHFAAGSSHDENDNGNRSAIHWDMVHIQRPDYGGGQIWFDGKLIRENGLFVPYELWGLNPNNLKDASAARTRASRRWAPTTPSV